MEANILIPVGSEDFEMAQPAHASDSALSGPAWATAVTLGRWGRAYTSYACTPVPAIAFISAGRETPP